MGGGHTKVRACGLHAGDPTLRTGLGRIKVTAPPKRFVAGESLNDKHHSAAAGTVPNCGVSLRSLSGDGRHGGLRQQLPTEVDPRGTEAIAPKAEVTDAHETFGQNVKKEAA